MEERPWKNENWFVSLYNYAEEILKNSKAPKKVLIHDTTLRDGEQQPEITFGKEDKIKLAILLDEAGVDRIEAGMPVVSKEDKEALKELTKLGLNADIFAFARCLKRDVDLALECDVPGIVMELPSSAHIIKTAYKWDLDKAIERAAEAVRYAKEHGLYVTFFTIDATRAEWEFFEKVLKTVENDMDSLTLADTFGACSPFAIMELVRKVKETIDVPIEIHAHNDLGMATANSLAAVYAGAEVVHVTVNGIGERCGNTPLEEIVLALKLFLNVDTNVKLDKLFDLSRAVESRSGVPVPPQKAVVGKNAFRVESGIIAEWWYNVKDNYPLEMFPYRWDLVGRSEPEIVLGKKSGKATIEHMLEDIGIKEYNDEVVLKILDDVKERSLLKKGPLSKKEFIEIVDKYL
ncbi:LeuA family protein [Thermococcus sp. LS2]|uniref:LeuA family protein n=1 Tax=Thermococcus sp. LS2 TaxID=1638260 RepID=UPI001439683C|nr:pyruvate carboxyltransferase [Thermococcus sp. LS2]NJE13161.1 pyruvate carboxyltransferase [Thermococcus sp. LS2]